MPSKPIPKFTAWSYSRLGDYEQCPLRAKLKHIDKIKEPGSAAMDRGATIHGLAAQYLQGTIKGFPKELALFKADFTELRKKFSSTLRIEEQWAFTKDWQACEWFGAYAWLRMVLDTAYFPEFGVMRIIDYKTGRVRAEEQKPQLSLYALGGFLLRPDVRFIVAEFWYIDHGETLKETFERGQLAGLKKHWAKKARGMFVDKIFAPRPGDKCRWCHYGAAKLGQCKF